MSNNEFKTLAELGEGKAEIAKTLEDSGLFWEECPSCKGEGYQYEEDEYGMNGKNYDCNRCDATGKILMDLDADQSEKILSDLGLQVVIWSGDDGYALTTINAIGLEDPDFIYDLCDIPDGERTLANNAALAWLVKQPEWLERLKISIDKTTQP